MYKYINFIYKNAINVVIKRYYINYLLNNAAPVSSDRAREKILISIIEKYSQTMVVEQEEKYFTLQLKTIGKNHNE